MATSHVCLFFCLKQDYPLTLSRKENHSYEARRCRSVQATTCSTTKRYLDWSRPELNHDQYAHQLYTTLDRTSNLNPEEQNPRQVDQQQHSQLNSINQTTPVTSKPTGISPWAFLRLTKEEAIVNIYEIVTNRIMELLEEGTVPWKKPWRSSEGPRNLISKKPYRGINSFLLNCSPYESDFYLTYNQAKQKGGQVRKGEKSTLVVFWKWLNTVTDAEETDEMTTGKRLTKVPILRYYNVFNLDQVDGIEPPKEPKIDNPFTAIEKAEQIIENMPLRPSIRYEGHRAVYSPMLDSVTLPPKESFTSSEEAYSTLFHELAHSTGHASRVGRKGVIEPTYFGSHDYSQEELVAELSASMLCGVAGIESTIENSAAYISGWLSVLKKDKKLLVLAAAQGQKAADYILMKEHNDQ